EIGSGDVVLVTGGTRGIGFKLAQALSERGAAVALAGRTPPPALPPRAVFVQWDVTKPAATALDDARARLGKFTAIVHAAALTEQGVRFIDDAAGIAAFLSALRGGWSGPVLLAHSRPARRIAHKVRMQVSRAEHPYLEDHQLAGQPVLPLAAALDVAAYAA